MSWVLVLILEVVVQTAGQTAIIEAAACCARAATPYVITEDEGR